jgi:CHAT domain-containing protein/tetratricopeptide (TPR) repeat protein
MLFSIHERCAVVGGVNFRAVMIALLAILAGEVSLAQPKRNPDVREKADRKADGPAAVVAQAMKLYEQGEYSEALKLFERYAKGVKAQLGADHPEYAVALNNMAEMLRLLNRPSEAEPLYRQALAIDSKYKDRVEAALHQSNFAALLEQTGKLEEAERLRREALAIMERHYGSSHPEVARGLNELALLLRDKNRLRDAEILLRRALSIDETVFGSSHPNRARDLNNLGQVLEDESKLKEAEDVTRQALAIDEQAFGAADPRILPALSNLASLLSETNQLEEAERATRRALEIEEKALGPDDENVARDLNKLALLLNETNRTSEAEPLLRRSIAIFEKNFGPSDPKVAVDLNNLAHILAEQGKAEEAEQLIRRALTIDEKSFGPEHQTVANRLNSLAQVLQQMNRLEEAAAIQRQAIAIVERTLGSENPMIAITINNLAGLLGAMKRYDEAEGLYQRSIAILETSLGPSHPKVGSALNNLAFTLEEQGEWVKAAALRARAMPIMLEARQSGIIRSAEAVSSIKGYARDLYHANPDDPAHLSQSFESAQWALQNAASSALALMSVRFSKGNGELANLLREEQDLIAERERAYQSLDRAAAQADLQLARKIRASISDLETRLNGANSLIASRFPDYAELAAPKPISIDLTQTLLGDREALMAFVDVHDRKRNTGETLVFFLTKTNALWYTVPLSTAALQQRISALRCGLDATLWRAGEESAAVCKTLLGLAANEYYTGAQTPPFDAGLSHALYRALFGPIEGEIANRSLLIVPSGPLTQLPFEVLVKQAPGGGMSRFEGFGSAIWLGQHHTIAVLPSIGSLKALRTANASPASSPFIGFGNPLLTGRSGDDRSAYSKLDCKNAGLFKSSSPRTLLAFDLPSLMRSGRLSADILRRQPPLPETADELCAAGRALGLEEESLDKAIFLGARATVNQIKALSKSGELAKAKIIHFATHGLLASETAFIANKVEPALLMTPPDNPGEDDTGLLTASDVAQLSINADWVVLSACNTAAGGSENAETLSGLARAFIYAGARSLLVSHWPVNSGAAVAITTGIVTALKDDPKLGRAEALRRSISSLIAKGGRTAHPSVWAPFVLVGNDG